MPKGASPQFRLVDVPHEQQLNLPVRFASKRGSDRIKARIYHDHRLRPPVAAVLLALSDFVDVRSKAWPKQALLAQMIHAPRETVGRWLAEAEALGVLEKDRHRPQGRCEYTFREAWVRWFRCDGGSLLDVTEDHFSTEPVQGTEDLYEEELLDHAKGGGRVAPPGVPEIAWECDGRCSGTCSRCRS